MGKQGSGSRYRKSRVKVRHHSIPELQALLESIGQWPYVVSITPAEIRHGAKTHGLQFRISRVVQHSIRLTARSSGAAQTVFIVSSNPEHTLEQLRQLPEFNGENSPAPPGNS